MVAVVGMIAEDRPQGSVDPHQVGNPLHEIVAQAYLWPDAALRDRLLWPEADVQA